MNKQVKKQTQNMFYFIFSLLGLSMVAIDPLIPVIAEKLKVGYDKIGIALFIGSIIMLLSTFIVGKLSDKFDIKKIIIFSLILLFIGFLVFGIYFNFLIFIIVLIMLRTGFGALDTSIHTFSSKLFRGKINKIFVMLDISWFGGAVIGPLLISAALFLNINTRFIFLFFSLAFAITLIFFYKICPAKKIDDVSAVKDSSHKNTGAGLAFSSIKNPVIILCGLILFFYIGAIAGFSSWLTTYFLAFNIKVSLGSIFLSLYWIFSIMGLLIINRLINKIKEINMLLWGCAAGTISLLLFSLFPNIYVKIIFLLALAMSFSGIFPLITAISAKEDSKETGTVLGFVIATAFSGSIVFQPIYGYVAEYLGKDKIVFIALGGITISLILIIVLFKIFGKRKNLKKYN